MAEQQTPPQAVAAAGATTDGPTQQEAAANLTDGNASSVGVDKQATAESTPQQPEVTDVVHDPSAPVITTATPTQSAEQAAPAHQDTTIMAAGSTTTKPRLDDAAANGGAVDVDTAQPRDFDGDLATNNELPSAETLKKIENYVVLDRHGKSFTFKSLYSGRNVARRVLFVFVRHFFCGNCQEYLRSLSESITTESLLRLPVSTFLVVIGCGDPELIDMYVKETKCPFPLYTDPKHALFDALGMVKSLALGPKPAYMKKSMLKSSLEGFGQALRQIPTGLALRSGDQRQVGGEFLFEPLHLATPVTTPQEEQPPMRQIAQDGSAVDGGDSDSIEEKRVTWCHRMKNTRDHAEIPELMEILGLDGHGQPINDQKRWTAALGSRKGTGITMASQMNQLAATAPKTK